MNREPAVEVLLRLLPEAADFEPPRRATEHAAGFDLRARLDEPLTLGPGQRRQIPTGIAIALPEGHEAQVRPRSGLAREHGVILPNAPGTIDADYRGELMVIVMNAGAKAFTVRRGDRIAQLVIAPVVTAEWDEVPTLGATERGAGGFGHTGHGAASGSSEEGT